MEGRGEREAIDRSRGARGVLEREKGWWMEGFVRADWHGDGEGAKDVTRGTPKL